MAIVEKNCLSTSNLIPSISNCDYFILGRPYVDKRKKYLHHLESHRKDKNWVAIKGTNEKVYVYR